MNADELERVFMTAGRRVLEIDDLLNLVADPAFLLVAWDRVRGDRGAPTAGVDGKTARSIEAGQPMSQPCRSLSTSTPSAASTSPVARAPEDAWERHSSDADAKGPRVYDRAAGRLPATDAGDSWYLAVPRWHTSGAHRTH